MPPDIAALSYANNFKWKNSDGEDRYRRGMYTFFKRTAPYPGLVNFDCPDSNTTCVERRISNTPLQALTCLNNEVFAEAAQALARRLLARAGGGIRGGQVYGETDEIGWGVTRDPVHINDLHATILHLFGLDHLKLTHRFQGRDFRLTDLGGKVIDRWLA